MTKDRVCANGTAVPSFTRRALLRSSPALALFPMAGAAAAADPLPGWFEEWKKACLAYEAHPTGEGPEADAISAEQFRLDGLISQTPATTKEGLAAKLDYALHEHSMFNVGIRQERRDLELVESIRASVRELVLR